MQIVKLHDTYFTHEQNDDILLSKSIFTAQICLIIEKKYMVVRELSWLWSHGTQYEYLFHNILCLHIPQYQNWKRKTVWHMPRTIFQSVINKYIVNSLPSGRYDKNFRYVIFKIISIIHQNRLTLILAWISNHMPGEMWEEITLAFPNLNGATIEVWERLSYFIPHYIMDVVIYPCWE